MTKHRQSKGRLCDEDVARHRFKGHAGRVGPAFVIAGKNDAGAFIFQPRLGRPQYVTGRVEADANAVQVEGLTVGTRVFSHQIVGFAVTAAHDGQGLGRRIDVAVPCPRMVGVAVGNDGVRHRLHRVDIEIARPAEDAFLADFDPVLRMHRHPFSSPLSRGEDGPPGSGEG